MVSGTKLRFPQGTARTWLLRCLDAAGRPVDGTGATPAAFFKRSVFDADAAALVDVSARVTALSPVDGTWLFTPIAADTAGLDPFALPEWQVRFTLASGKVYAHELHQGPLVFAPLTGDPDQPEPPSDYVEQLVDMTSLTAQFAAIVNRADLTGLSAALLATLPNGYRLVLGFTGDIRVEYQIGLLAPDAEDAYGWVVAFDHAATRCARLVGGSVHKQGQPCGWNATQNKFQQTYPAGAAGAEVANLGPAFDLP